MVMWPPWPGEEAPQPQPHLLVPGFHAPTLPLARPPPSAPLPWPLRASLAHLLSPPGVCFSQGPLAPRTSRPS